MGWVTVLLKIWRKPRMNTNFNYKSIETFIEKITNALNLMKFRNVINNAITEQYTTAIGKLDNKLGLPINLVPKIRDLNFLQDYVNQNIQDASDDIANNIRQEIQRGILNGENTDQLAKRIKFMFKEKKYQTRMKTIIRTETLRANNMGTLEGAKQAASTGLKLTKWLDVIMDNKTSDICKAEHKKYGSKEQAIPLDEEFVVTVKNKTYKSQTSPFHPNCRTVVRILRVV